MNPIWKVSISTVFLFLVVVCTGCNNNSVAPIISDSADTITFVGNFSNTNIWMIDSFAASQMIKVLWRTGVGSYPPYFYFQEVGVYLSSTSPDSGYSEIFRRIGDGEDSTIVDGLVNGSAYYIRIATYDSTGELNSLSHPLMTIPGTPEPPGLQVSAPQRDFGEWVTNISWSPDGQHLAFIKMINNSVNIFVLQVSDMSINQVTNYTGTDYRLLSVYWSPDDQWLSYTYTPTRTAGSVDYRIWLIPPTGGTPRSVSSGAVDAGAAWESPTKLIFTKGTRGPPNIPEFYRIDIAESNHESSITTDQALRKYDPSLNVDRGLIAFRGSEVISPNPYGLYIMPIDGGEYERLTLNNHWSDIHPSWSVDGQRIYFTSSRSGHYEIWSIDIQSRQLRQVTRCQTRGFNRFYGRQSPNEGNLALLEVGDQNIKATIQIISAQ